MNNLFCAKDSNGSNLVIHEKYDIKGSTVNRSAAPPSEGQVVNCKNCEQKFIYHRKQRRRKGTNPAAASGGGGSSSPGSPKDVSRSVSSDQSNTTTTSYMSRSILGGLSESEEDVNRYVNLANTPIPFVSSKSHAVDLCGICRCVYTVNGEHEPNVILKDNDLKYKIRLPRNVAKRVVTQLEADANFLLSVGVMDYSLLGENLSAISK
jgi:hypothetical protein